ncbi:GNAT family N-acetyltransferase [Paenibacillus sp. Marseille-Q4541]|uniref:GNAT family N-acetyltransferase n=1 Tax=Paenibacillus sp. Marseille-Q4541 TaxID=2831522 RepID=UPI001BAE0134|nr:GNAT family N-acetyltransferase [Paenibacillus sp. Marseille-Q4541]
MNISLREVTEDNKKDILQIQVKEAQSGYIETVEDCLAEAAVCRMYKPVGLYLGELLVGFAMYGFFPEEGKQGRAWMDRLVIDASYQGQGLGTVMLEALIEKLISEYDCEQVYLSVYEDNVVAIRMYEKAGFCFNGERDEKGEKIMVKKLT